MWLGPSVFVSSSPVAFVASVLAVRRDRYGVLSRTALAVGTLELLVVVAVAILNVIL